MLYMCHNAAWKSIALSSNYSITMHLSEISRDMPGIITWKYTQILTEPAIQTSYICCPILISTRFKTIDIDFLLTCGRFLMLPLSDMELISKTLPLLETMALAVKSIFFLGYLLINVQLNYVSTKHCIWIAFICTRFSETNV